MLAAVKNLKPSKLFIKLGTVKTAIERADVGIKLHHYKVRHFAPNLSFQFERGHFLVKTAQSGQDLEKCLRLRFEVFHKEYMHKKRQLGIDVDHLDYSCDHLMIIDQRSASVIGTYRLNSSQFTNTFYSEGEFQMEKVKELIGPHLELGRACIERAHRSGAVIALLWRGIAEYIRQTNTQVLFGCSSIKTIEPMQIAGYVKFLRDTHRLAPDLAIQPIKKFRVAQLPFLLNYLDENPTEYENLQIESNIPALFRSYMKMGAKFSAEPALDREFYCIDFLTVIRTADFSTEIKGKYAV
jgi:putative hemolysin